MENEINMPRYSVEVTLSLDDDILVEAGDETQAAEFAVDLMHRRHLSSNSLNAITEVGEISQVSLD